VARVLVVDADLVLLSLVTDVLENADYVVSKARSGSEGLKLLRGSDHFDLLIADVGVQDTSGVRLIQKARTEWPDLRVVAMSEFDGNESVSLRQSLRRLGVVQVLRKPFAVHVLVEALGALLGGRKVLVVALPAVSALGRVVPAAAAAAGRPLLGLADLQLPSAEILAVKGGHGRPRLVGRSHLHKAEATGVAAEPVGHHVGRGDDAVSGEQVSQLVVGRRVAQVSYVNSLAHNLSFASLQRVSHGALL